MASTRVLLVLTGRTSELRLSGAPWALTTDLNIDSMRTLDLEVLSPEDTQLLIERLVTIARKPDAPIHRIRRASGGNPLAIELLSREWGEHGTGSLLSDLEALDTQPVPAIGIPRAISAIFERQSLRLEPVIRATLDLAAVLGRRLTEVSLYAAIELSPGQAAEALSRLRDEGYLRDVSGDLEFRNELIRAQAYYAVAGAIRQHLHRRVAELLSQRHSQDDRTVSLEIAWHHLRGGDVSSALPFALDGADAVLAVGAPHGAEEILKALVNLCHEHANSKRVRLLLARALIDQSKFESALPIIHGLEIGDVLNSYETAELAMIRAAIDFGLNRERDTKYVETAKGALHATTMTGDTKLISRALFECARAGTEEGSTELVDAAELGINELAERTLLDPLPMVVLTKAFCRFFFWDYEAAVSELKTVLQSRSATINVAESCYLYSGMGIAKHFLGRFDDAHEALIKSLNFANRLGDDARASQVASNLCAVELVRGRYDEAIHYGEMGIRIGEACESGGLLPCYTNLMDSYLLVGRENDAIQCLEKARKWLIPERRWKLRCAFFTEAASFALGQRNHALALDLIAQLEQLSQGREQAVPMPGPYWKLMIFRQAHINGLSEAYNLAEKMMELFNKRCPFHSLDVTATAAWLERRMEGRISERTREGLRLFESLKVEGKKALLTLQGFLVPNDHSNPIEARGAPRVTVSKRSYQARS